METQRRAAGRAETRRTGRAMFVISAFALLAAFTTATKEYIDLLPVISLDSRVLTNSRSTVFTEAGPPAQLATDYLLLTERLGGHIVSATVVITNILDTVPGKGELLAIPEASRTNVSIKYDPIAGVLALQATIDPLGRLVSQDTNADLTAALSSVTYENLNTNPDDTTRLVEFRVTDASGTESLPALAYVALVPVNNLPQLDLNGPFFQGADYSVTLLETERMLTVPLCEAATTLSDLDGLVLASMTFQIEGARPDGIASELLDADVAGSSIAKSYDSAAGVLLLSGVDTPGRYLSAILSARYSNKGQLVLYANHTPPTSELRFTPGLRSVLISVTDTFGGVGQARAYVTIVARPRVGDPARDPTMIAPTACKGHGVFQYLPMDKGGPQCVCDVGFEGDECEIPPCMAQGAYNHATQKCDCFRGYSGTNCTVACSNHGKMTTVAADAVDSGGNVLTGSCICDPQYAGVDCSVKCTACSTTNGVCDLRAGVVTTAYGTYADDAATICRCRDGWMGASCTIPCPCYFGTAQPWTHNGPVYFPGQPAHGSCVFAASGAAQVPACVCQQGWTGTDCSIQCPQCTEHGSCAVPEALPGGLTELMLRLAALTAAVRGLGTNAVASSIAALPDAGLLASLEAQKYVSGVTKDVNGDYSVSLATVVMGRCACDQVSENSLGGVGYNGFNCTVPCQPCAAGLGTCTYAGLCSCGPGLSGADCSQVCNGNGALDWPVFNSTYTRENFVADVVASGNVLVSSYTDAGGLFNSMTRFLQTGPNGETIAYCACGQARQSDGSLGPVLNVPTNAYFGKGYIDEFCSTPCPPCSPKGKCIYTGGAVGLCKCDVTSTNTAISRSVLAAGYFGVGYTGPECNVPCRPCFNGACNTAKGTTGECICRPGFTDDACLLECGSFGYSLLSGNYIGSRGKVRNVTALGTGLNGTRALCICDKPTPESPNGWTGPYCSHECPYPYDPIHGICVLANSSEPKIAGADTKVVCQKGYTGLPPSSPLSPWMVDAESGESIVGVPQGRNCSVACDPCVNGRCQLQGECLCQYGYIWQGPLDKAAIGGPSLGRFPYPQLGLAGLDPTYHSCKVAHPCSQNGEYLNATCGNQTAVALAQKLLARGGNLTGVQDELVPLLWVRFGQPWVAAYGGGWGCTGTYVAGNAIPGAVTVGLDSKCLNGSFLFAMAYATFDRDTEFFKRGPLDLISHTAVGEIQGAICEAPPDPITGMNIGGGYCVCDSIAVGRFRFPSSAMRPGSGAYDYYFQGWAGANCSIPCAPCSQNGLCSAVDGTCTCAPGWTGYRCLTPCEPCEHGKCQTDGTCLCDGPRRQQEGTYALRLTRDPLYFEEGQHDFTVHGARRTEYVHPAYMTAATVEDYIWEVEYECEHRPACVSRTIDTLIPIRPNETYFRYTTPVSNAAMEGLAAIALLDIQIAALKKSVVDLPYSLNGTALCNMPGEGFGIKIKHAQCLVIMKENLMGRTTDSCGDNWDSVRSWSCDDNIKAQFVGNVNLQIGRLELQRLQISSAMQNTGLSEQRWLHNNRNERQRLLNTQSRGFYNVTSGLWQPLRDPDYYMIWIIQQILYGVTGGSDDGPGGRGYSGWNCSIPCDKCDTDHGTCQFDGSCECVTGWYGADCSLPCACALFNGTNAPVNTTVLQTVYSSSGYAIQASGTCQRDGSCSCYDDDSGSQWTGRDCYTQCAPCSHGKCQFDGSCLCDEGYAGDSCSLLKTIPCLRCDFSHGTCQADGVCKCDQDWTGADCSTRCLPCFHGDCQMDGYCYCRPGWTLPDCSKHVGPDIVRAEFNDGPEGWQSYNNSCRPRASAVGASYIGELADPADVGSARPATALFYDCDDALAGGDGGLQWDAAQGQLYLRDALPADDPNLGQLGYFRAPRSFLDDGLAFYNGTLSWSLHVADAYEVKMQQAAQVAHEPLKGADLVLIGGLPSYRLDPPDYVAWNKTRLYSWSRAAFPELRLNIRWGKARIAALIRAYLATPQVVLTWSQPLAPAPYPSVGYPPTKCRAQFCNLNFNVDILAAAGWYNAPIVPSGFKWGVSQAAPGQTGSGLDPALVEAIPYILGREGAPYNPFGPQDASVAVGDLQDLDAADAVAARQAAAGTGGAAPDGGEPAWDYSLNDGPGDYIRGDQAELFVYSGSLVASAALPNATRTNVTILGAGRVDAQGTAMTGTTESWWADQVDNYNVYGIWRDPGRLEYDMPPEVYDAIALNRRSRLGQRASTADLLWVLASFQELLIRGDYYYQTNAVGQPWMGAGETVRLDSVAFSRQDPQSSNATFWASAEYSQYIDYLKLVAATYDVRFLADYVAAWDEKVRLSICSGNGVHEQSSSSPTGVACRCIDGYTGSECQFACPKCTRGACAVNAAATAAVCACDPPYGGASCELICPDCDANHTTVTHCLPDYSGAQGPGRDYVCDCLPGLGGGLCQLPCNRQCVPGFSVCNSTTYFGYPNPSFFPGTETTCSCVTNRTGLLCELPCPACQDGRCDHLLGSSLPLSQVNDALRATDRALCECNDGSVGTLCEKPCPGSPRHPTERGNATCTGRGVCSDPGPAATEGSCSCFSGFLGPPACELFKNQNGDKVINFPERCDDGNFLPGDGCDRIGGLEPGYVCEWTLRSDVAYVAGLYYPYNWSFVNSTIAQALYTPHLTVLDKAYWSVCTCVGKMVNGVCTAVTL